MSINVFKTSLAIISKRQNKTKPETGPKNKTGKGHFQDTKITNYKNEHFVAWNEISE